MFPLRQLQQLLQSQPLGALRLAAKLVRTNSTLAATFGLEAVWGWTCNWFRWRWMGTGGVSGRSTNLKDADSWWPSERIDRYVLVQSDWIRWSWNSWHAMCLSDCPFHHSLSCLQHALTILNSFLLKLHCFHNMLQSLASSQASNTFDSLILGNTCSCSAGIVMVLCRPVVVEFSRTRRSGGAGWSWGNHPMLHRWDGGTFLKMG